MQTIDITKPDSKHLPFVQLDRLDRGRRGFDEPPHEGRENLVAAVLGGFDQRHLRRILLAVHDVGGDVLGGLRDVCRKRRASTFMGDSGGKG